MDCGLLGSSVHRILQAGILKWVAMPSSRGSSQPRDQTCLSCGSCIAGEFFTTEPPEKWLFKEHRGKLWNERRDGRQNRESWVWMLIEASPEQRENSASRVCRKSPVLSYYVFLACVLSLLSHYRHAHKEHFTCDISDPQYVSPPPQAILCNTSWISWLLTHFWHYLPEVVSECQLQAQNATWVFDQLAIAWRVQ